MSPEQCRAARAWLKLSMEDLATSAGVAITSVRNFEGHQLSRLSTAAAAMQSALERRGVFFLKDEGIIIPKGKRPTKPKNQLDEPMVFPKERGLRF